MSQTHKKLTSLLTKLEEKGTLTSKKVNVGKFKDVELARHIKDRFAADYPELKIKRLMETVHYANTFNDATLQEIAFLVDEISEYLFKLEIANRDFVVGYFNAAIIDPKVEATELNFVLMEIESLLENSYQVLPEEF